MDFVEPVEFSSLLPAIEVGPPVRFIDEEGAFLRDVLVVRQPLSDIEGSRGLFLMQLTKDGAPLGPGPLDTMEVPISCAAGDERGEINIKVDILSPVGDVVAEGVETLVQYDCAESQEEVEPRRHRGDDGGILGGTDAGNFAADAGVGGTEAPASSGCSVGVSGGEPAGLGVWTFLVAVMFGRRRRSRV